MKQDGERREESTAVGSDFLVTKVFPFNRFLYVCTF